jgi:hypothetical protein
MSEQDETEAVTEEDEELEDLDYVDPLKRDPDRESLPGLDPIVPPVPPDN